MHKLHKFCVLLYLDEDLLSGVCFLLKSCRNAWKRPTKLRKLFIIFSNSYVRHFMKADLVCTGLVFALAIKKSSVQTAGYYREGWCCHQGWVLKQGSEQQELLKYLQNNDPPCRAGIPFLYSASWEFKKKLKGEFRYKEQKWNILFEPY